MESREPQGSSAPPAQEQLSTPAKLGVSIALGLITAVIVLAASLAIFYIEGRLTYQGYESIALSFVVATASGLSVFVICLLDIIAGSRILTGTERAGFMKFSCWLSVALPIDAWLEPVLDLRLFHIRDGTLLILRWPSQFMIAGLFGIAAGISKKKWGWIVWGMIPLLLAIAVVILLLWPGFLS
jgi:hypothetical protein